VVYYWPMNKITITCHNDNSFNVKVNDNKLLCVTCRNGEWSFYDPLGDFKMSAGTDVLPDWTSIIQYCNELV